MSEAIRILGIDPGLRHTGWGVIDLVGSRLSHVGHGVINIDPDLPMADRLAGIFHAVGELVNTYAPDHSAANDNGMVEFPNVNLEEEVVRLMQAEAAYKANILVLKTVDEMHDALFKAFEKRDRYA